MFTDDLLRNRQSEPGPLRLTGFKHLKDIDALWYPLPRVINFQHRLVRGPMQGNRQFSSTWYGAGITITFEKSQDLPRVTADRDKLKQVILNLCKNAVDAPRTS